MPLNLHVINFDEITFKDVVDFCSQKIIENIQLDYKEQLPRSMSKHLASFSNTKGGLIIVGVGEDGKTGEPVKWDGITKDGKLIDQIYQHAANVTPYPTIKVRYTDEVSGKVFLLIHISEGGSPPYQTVSDPTIWVRTGNVSTPLNQARQEDLDRLYQKKNSAEALRSENISKAKSIYSAELDRAEATRKKEHAAKADSVYGNSLLSHSSVLSILIQPFYPGQEIAGRQEVLGKISEYRVTNILEDFPKLQSTRSLSGISCFEWHRHDGGFDCQVVFGNGLIFNAKDIRYSREGRPEINMNHIAAIVARQMKVATNFYSLFGFTGVLSGEVTLNKAGDLHVAVLAPSGYHRWLSDDHITKLNEYRWELNLDTHLLTDKKAFYDEWKKLLDIIHWDLGLSSPQDEVYKDFFEKDLKLFN
jgi:hypothetical protein